MTLIINLPQEAEQRLREKAAREGQDAETVAAAVLIEALGWEAGEPAEAIEGIQRGLDQFAAGRSRPFVEFAEEQRRRHGLPRRP